MRFGASCGLAASVLCLAVVGCGETKVTLNGNTIGGTGKPASSTTEIEAWLNATRQVATLPTPHLYRYATDADVADALAGRYADALATTIRQHRHIGALGTADRRHKTDATYIFRLDVSGVMRNLSEYDCTTKQRVAIGHGTSTVTRSAFVCTIR